MFFGFAAEPAPLPDSEALAQITRLEHRIGADLPRYDRWRTWQVRLVGAHVTQRNEAFTGLHIEVGDGLQQSLQIRMPRPPEDLLGRPGLHDLAVVDHHHLIGHVGDDTEIMGNQQHAHVELLLQLFQQTQHLGLDGHVQRRGRFVGDQQRRAAYQGHRDHGTLAQPTRQLERIHIEGAGRIRETHQPQHFFAARAGFLLVHGKVDRQRFRDLVADGVQRRQGGHRLLEDHRHPGAAHLSIIRAVGVEGSKISHRTGPADIQQDAAAGYRPDLRQNAHDGLRNNRLPRAGFADQRHNAAAPDPKADAFDDLMRNAM